MTEPCVRVACPSRVCLVCPSRVFESRAQSGIRVVCPGCASESLLRAASRRYRLPGPVPCAVAAPGERRAAARMSVGLRRASACACVCALACVRECGTWAAIRRPASRASSICRRRRPTRVLTPPDSDNDSDPHRRTDSPCGGSGGGPAPRRHTLAYRQATGRAGPRQLEGDKPRGDGGAGPGGRRPR